jgi:amino acid permease
MFTGIQEILILVAIIVGILFLPRILNRGQESRQVESKSPFVLSGKIRLAIAASILWPVVIAVVMEPWKKDLFPFLYIGLCPVVLVWVIFWVYTGFRNKKR